MCPVYFVTYLSGLYPRVTFTPHVHVHVHVHVPVNVFRVRARP